MAASLRITAPGHTTMRCGRTSRRSVACAAGVKFWKYQGIGNDFILVDNRHKEEPILSPEESARLCDRNYGIGGDGVIFALPPTGDTDMTMRIYNADGSEPEMCGNGIRCLARFVADIDGQTACTYKISTLAGLIQPELLKDGRVRVDMGKPILNGAEVPTTLPAGPDGTVLKAPLEVAGKTWSCTCVSMGNPHCIIYSNSDGDIVVDDIDLFALGPLFENNEVFPARTNTEFVEVLSPTHLKMSVWERGSGRTLACGTGTCALVVAGVLEGRCERSVRVDLPGGPLDIEWDEATGKIFMTGAADLVFSGEVPEPAEFVPTSDPLEDYCSDNPETDECRVYED